MDGKRKIGEKEAFLSLGKQLGARDRASLAAYEAGVQARDLVRIQRLEQQRNALQQPGLKILIVGHDYNAFDDYVGAPIRRMLQQMQVTPGAVGRGGGAQGPGGRNYFDERVSLRPGFHGQ